MDDMVAQLPTWLIPRMFGGFIHLTDRGQNKVMILGGKDEGHNSRTQVRVKKFTNYTDDSIHCKVMLDNFPFSLTPTKNFLGVHV